MFPFNAPQNMSDAADEEYCECCAASTMLGTSIRTKCTNKYQQQVKNLTQELIKKLKKQKAKNIKKIYKQKTKIILK